MPQIVKNLPAIREASLGPEGPLEMGMATYSSTLALRIPWTEEPGGLHSKGSQRVGQDWASNTRTHCVAVLGLRCCMWAFSSCGRGCSLAAVGWHLTAVASPVAERGLEGTWPSGVVLRLSCCVACGFFLEQGSNLCSLHWQVDAPPLDHQGNPRIVCWCNLLNQH